MVSAELAVSSGMFDFNSLYATTGLQSCLLDWTGPPINIGWPVRLTSQDTSWIFIRSPLHQTRPPILNGLSGWLWGHWLNICYMSAGLDRTNNQYWMTCQADHWGHKLNICYVSAKLDWTTNQYWMTCQADQWGHQLKICYMSAGLDRTTNQYWMTCQADQWGHKLNICYMATGLDRTTNQYWMADQWGHWLDIHCMSARLDRTTNQYWMTCQADQPGHQLNIY